MKKLLLDSTKEVERLMNENIKIKECSISELKSSHENWEINSKTEIETFKRELTTTQVCLLSFHTFNL